MWLIGRLIPDFKTIADFRKDNKQVVISIFKEFSLFCNELNLIGKEIVAIDGSKFCACNSRRKNFTKRKVGKMFEYYEQAAKKYLKLLENSDDNDTDNVKIDATKIEEKLQNAKKRIEELHLLEKELLVDKITVIADKGYYNGEDLKKCEENGIINQPLSFSVSP